MAHLRTATAITGADLARTDSAMPSALDETSSMVVPPWPTDPVVDHSGAPQDLAVLDEVDRVLPGRDPALLRSSALRCRERASFHGTDTAVGSAWFALAGLLDAIALGGLEPSSATVVAGELRRTIGRGRVPAAALPGDRAKRRFWR